MSRAEHLRAGQRPLSSLLHIAAVYVRGVACSLWYIWSFIPTEYGSHWTTEDIPVQCSAKYLATRLNA